MQGLITIKIHQNEDLLYLFANLQFLCDGLIADCWLYGEDKAFRGRTVLIYSLEQTDHILVPKKQAAHPSTTTFKVGQFFPQGEKIKPKIYCKILRLFFPTLPQQFSMFSNRGTANSLL